MDLTFFTQLLLGVTALVAGFVDSVAGGGGLITLPALLLAGVPPHTALGTNRLQACVGESVAAFHYLRSGKVNFKTLYKVGVFTLIGAALGTTAVQQLPVNVLRSIIPPLLVAVLVYSLLSGKLFAEKPLLARFSVNSYAVIFGLGIGFYNGFFGPGTGAFWIAAGTLFLGLNVQHSAMLGKPLNAAANILSLFWFFHAGQALLMLGAVMACGQIIGASIGARFVVKEGVEFIKPIYRGVVALLAIQLLWDSLKHFV